MKYRFYVLCLFIILSPLANAGDAESGRLKAQTCLGCHGVPSYGNIYPSYHVPKLVGQHAPYIISALKAYQSGERSHPTMRAHASGLSETDMADIAAYFSGSETVSGSEPVAASAQPPQLSEELNAKLAVCAGCHGMDGNSAMFPEHPRLAGQYRDYLYQSLLDYRDGKRNNPIMLSIIGTINEADMGLLSLYFSKQQGLSAYRLERRALKDN